MGFSVARSIDSAQPALDELLAEARALLGAGCPAEALARFERAVDLVRGMDDPACRAASLIQIAHVHLSGDRALLTHRCLQSAFTEQMQAWDRQGTEQHGLWPVGLLLAAAHLAMLRGEWNEARALLHAAAALACGLELAAVRRAQADLFGQAGRPAAARAHILSALRLASRHADRRLRAALLMELGHLEHRLRRFRRALDCFQAAAGMFLSWGDRAAEQAARAWVVDCRHSARILAANPESN